MKPFYETRKFSTIREMFDQTAELYGDRPAFEIKSGKNNNKYITYGEYITDINALSNYLCSLGRQSEYVSVCGDNCYEYCLLYVSTVCSGKVIVPIDKELHEDDIVSIIKTCNSKMLVCDEKIYSKVKDKLDNDILVILFGKHDNELSLKSAVDTGNLLLAGGKALYKSVILDPDKMCTLLFTSGTTGTSKGVMLCQRNFCFEIKAAMGVLKISPDDCAISMLPFHHTFESSIIIFFAPYCGAKITFCEGIKYVLRNMKEFEPTIFVAVPLILETVHKRILREIKKKKHGDAKFKIGKAVCKVGSKLNLDLKKIIFKEVQDTFGGKMRLIICGGASIDPQIIKDFDSFGIQVLYGYGLTECAPLAIINHDRLRTTDSIGEPLPGVSAKIIDKDENGIGELCVKGDMVMLGYYNNPEETAECIDSDGYLHTGDLAYIDKRGCYHIAGRSKNVIVTSNGKNIYPEELEYHLNLSESINSCLVEGITNNKGETEIHAEIYPEYDEFLSIEDKNDRKARISETIKAVVDEVNERLPGFKRIKSYNIREKDFERTTAKKIKRKGRRNEKKN